MNQVKNAINIGEYGTCIVSEEDVAKFMDHVPTDSVKEFQDPDIMFAAYNEVMKMRDEAISDKAEEQKEVVAKVKKSIDQRLHKVDKHDQPCNWDPFTGDLPIKPSKKTEPKIKPAPEYAFEKFIESVAGVNLSELEKKVESLNTELKNLAFDPWKLIGCYDMMHHQITSFNDYLRDLPETIRSFFPLKIRLNKSNEYRCIELHNIYIDHPKIKGGRGTNDPTERDFLPIEARLRNLTYYSQIYGDFRVYDEKNNLIEYSNHTEFMQIPILLGSNRCHLSSKDRIQCGECVYDSLGYFVVNGVERTIVAQERLRYDFAVILQTTKKDEKKKYAYIARCHSDISSGDRPGVVKLKIPHSGTGVLAFFPPFVKAGVPAGLLLLYLDQDLQSEELAETISEKEYSDYLTARNERLFKYICPEDSPDPALKRLAWSLIKETPTDVDLIETLVDSIMVAKEKTSNSITVDEIVPEEEEEEKTEKKKSKTEKKKKIKQPDPEEMIREILDHEIFCHNRRRENRVFYMGMVLRDLFLT